MSESITVYQRLKDFVNKYNNDELDFIKSPTAEQSTILTSLASAVNAFEIQENELEKNQLFQKLGLKEFYPYYEKSELQNVFDVALSNLNRWMKIAKANNLYTDSKLQKEIDEFKTEKDQIQTKINNLNTQNGKLVEENIKFRKGLRKLFDENPEIEDKYGWLLENTKKEVSKID